ncbi:MAG TPA: hypothetical protein VEI97_14440 [bacterium]|nr:hypothetical protein [bacterium]
MRKAGLTPKACERLHYIPDEPSGQRGAFPARGGQSLLQLSPPLPEHPPLPLNLFKACPQFFRALSHHPSPEHRRSFKDDLSILPRLPRRVNAL